MVSSCSAKLLRSDSTSSAVTEPVALLMSPRGPGRAEARPPHRLLCESARWPLLCRKAQQWRACEAAGGLHVVCEVPAPGTHVHIPRHREPREGGECHAA